MGWRVILHRTVVVNLTTGTAIAGVLLRRTGPLLVLANATVHEPDSVPAQVDGEVVIERSKVAFIQALPARG